MNQSVWISGKTCQEHGGAKRPENFRSYLFKMASALASYLAREVPYRVLSHLGKHSVPQFIHA